MIGGFLSLHWRSWRDRGAEPWVVEVLKSGCAITFHTTPIVLDSYSPRSIKGRALEEEIQALHRKGVVEPASPTPGFYSHMFVITKASGGWRPIIDLSVLNLSVDRTPFRMENTHTVLRSGRRNEWMVSIDLKNAYLQIPIHPASRRFLRFPAGGRTWQFRAVHGTTGLHLHDGSSFRVPPLVGHLDAAVSGRLADSGVFSGESLLDKGPSSQLMPGAGNCCKSGEIDFASILPDCVSGNQDRFADFQGFGDSLEDRKVLLNSRRISDLKGAVCEVLEGAARPPRVSGAPRSEWPAAHESLATGSKVRLGFSGGGDLVPWDAPFRDYLRWWCPEGHLEEGVSLALHSPDQMFWSDASDLGWGAMVADCCVSGV